MVQRTNPTLADAHLSSQRRHCRELVVRPVWPGRRAGRPPRARGRGRSHR